MFGKFGKFGMFGKSEGAQRENGKITLYLSPHQPTPAAIPSELQGHISPDDWTVRIPAIIALASKFSRPLFERIWHFVGFIAIFVLPIVLYRVIVDAFIKAEGDSTASFFEARAISLGVFVGTAVFFWLPVAVWKFIGMRRMKALLARWARSDQVTKSAGSFLPEWKVKTPSVFRSAIILTISTPPDAPPTLFHPAAYMPSFVINQSAEDAVANYPYQSDQPTLAYNGSDSLPEYATDGDTKHFEDVKV